MFGFTKRLKDKPDNLEEMQATAELCRMQGYCGVAMKRHFRSEKYHDWCVEAHNNGRHQRKALEIMARTSRSVRII